MAPINYTTPIVFSIISAIFLLLFYLYKTENDKLIRPLSLFFMKNRYRPAEIQKDTRRQDLVLLAVLIILIFTFGMKLVTFTVVISDSMKPMFGRGDLILSQSINKEPQVGDIITFKPKDEMSKTITHRVIKMKGDSITTQGDNNPFPDDPIRKSDIVAKTLIVRDKPIVLKGVGALFILDFTKEGTLYKLGDKFEFFQQLFLVIRTWGYVITVIALIILIMNMTGKR